MPGPPQRPDQQREDRWQQAAEETPADHGGEDTAASSQPEAASAPHMRLSAGSGATVARPLTPRPPLGERGRQALTAVAITAGAAIAPAIALLLRREPGRATTQRGTALDA